MMKTCDLCGDLSKHLHIVSDQDNDKFLHVCDTCFKTECHHCEKCGEMCLGESLNYIHSKDICVCDACYDEYYAVCDWCDTEYPKEEMTRVPEKNFAYLCPECIKEAFSV